MGLDRVLRIHGHKQILILQLGRPEDEADTRRCERTRESPRANGTRPTPHVAFDNTALNDHHGLRAEWVVFYSHLLTKKLKLSNFSRFFKVYVHKLPSFLIPQADSVVHSITAADGGFSLRAGESAECEGRECAPQRWE